MQVNTKVELQCYNSYRLCATAENVYFPEKIEDFQALFRSYPAEEFFIIGGGYNIILGEQEYKKKRFIIIRENFADCTVEGTKITANSGCFLKKLSETALEHCLTGVEIFYDIPGTVGGAVWMNAGAYGVSFTDFVEEVVILNKETNQIEHLSGHEIQKGYRFSQFQDGKSIILSATLALEKGNYQEIKEKMDYYYNLRTERFPKEYPNAGSVFKRPPNAPPVGVLLEKAGMKGTSVGGAMISPKHAGFIVNYNNAKADDIIKLTEVIKKKVFETYNIELSLEQVIVLD